MQFSQPVPSQHQMQNQTQILLYPFSAQNTNSRVVNLLNESYDSLTSAHQFMPGPQLDTSMHQSMLNGQQPGNPFLKNSYFTAQAMPQQPPGHSQAARGSSPPKQQ